MKAVPNARCGKVSTVAGFVRLGPGLAELWIGHTDEGKYRYGFLLEGTEEELEAARLLMQAINDPGIPMLPGTMGEAMAWAANRGDK